jgi:hypothetical protein
MSIPLRQRSRSEQKAAFSRMSSFSDFNNRLNAEFKAGIPSSREVLFTDKTMEIKKPLMGNLSPYRREIFGKDLDNNFSANPNSVDPELFTKVVTIEEGIRHYKVNEPVYRSRGISLHDFLTVEEAKRRIG